MGLLRQASLRRDVRRKAPGRGEPVPTLARSRPSPTRGINVPPRQIDLQRRMKAEVPRP
jgi:hypothetical protein